MIFFKNQASKWFNLLNCVILCLLCLLLNYLTKIHFERMYLPKDVPEFTIFDAKASLYSQDGNIKYEVFAKKAYQYAKSTQVNLESINFSDYKNNQSTELLHNLTSDNGWLDTKSKFGYLDKNVVLTVNNPDPKQITKIYTNNLYFDGNKKFINSSAPITAIQGKSSLTGVGFSVDYDKQLINIYSKVKVVYVK